MMKPQDRAWTPNLCVKERTLTKHSSTVGVTKVKNDNADLSSFVAAVHLPYCFDEPRAGLWALTVEENCTVLPIHSWETSKNLGRVSCRSKQTRAWCSLKAAHWKVCSTPKTDLLPLYIISCGPGLMQKRWGQLPNQRDWVERNMYGEHTSGLS